MVPLIENEIVTKRKWIAQEDFIDLLAISQSGRRTARVVYFYSRKLRRGSFPQPGAPGCGVRAAGKGACLCCSVRFCSCGFFCRW